MNWKRSRPVTGTCCGLQKSGISTRGDQARMGRKRKDGYDGIGLTVTLYVAGIAAALVILGAMLRSGHALKALLMSVLQGVAALFAVNVLGTLTGVTLAVNWWTLGISSLGGTAGVVFLLVLNVIL